MRNVLVTGGAGFIGCNFVRYILGRGDEVSVVVLDALTYAGNLGSLSGLEANERYHFVRGSICDEKILDFVFGQYDVDTVVNFAAESHVDRSIDGPKIFVDTNVSGTFALLQAARKAWGGRDGVRFHHVSTDEVFGSLGPSGSFSEGTPYDPSSPYSATKAASDHLVRAWNRTFGLPVTITNCSNNYGPYQFPEKLIPLFILNCLKRKPLPVYGNGKNVRDWLYVEDHCRAIDAVLRKGKVGETYAVGGGSEMTNIDLVCALCEIMDEKVGDSIGSHKELITFVNDRPGHDHRYSICSDKIERELGWRPSESLRSGLERTVDWYLNNGSWVEDAEKRYRGQRLGVGV